MAKGKTQKYYDANPAATSVGLHNKHDITKTVKAIRLLKKL